MELVTSYAIVKTMNNIQYRDPRPIS